MNARRVSLSREFLLSRGRCCRLGCTNCPYIGPTVPEPSKTQRAEIANCLRSVRMRLDVAIGDVAAGGSSKSVDEMLESAEGSIKAARVLLQSATQEDAPQ